jgi:hypothetical protein
MVIVADTFLDEEMLYSSPSFCLYFENKQEILNNFELFMTQKEYMDYVNKRIGDEM